MRIKNLFLSLVAGGLLFASCSTPKNVVYFPDLQNETVVMPAQIHEIKVRPEDKLYIVVTAQDPALSALFNLVAIQNRITNSTGSSTATGVTNSSNGILPYYTVDPQGDIDFPVIGKIHIAGLTRSQIADKIVKQLEAEDLVKDPIVTVEFANTAFTILGSVKNPGRYTFNKDHLTIIDALGMAGDLVMNGVRENILVMRTDDNGQVESYRVSLLDAKELAASPAYYIQQNDVIYVEPNDKMIRETTPNGNSPYTPSFWVSIGSFAVTISTLIITLAK